MILPAGRKKLKNAREENSAMFMIMRKMLVSKKLIVLLSVMVLGGLLLVKGGEAWAGSLGARAGK